ncbi:MAG: TadE/TadG family type IV pilus assembly protein [Chloroflexota bacterium]
MRSSFSNRLTRRSTPAPSDGQGMVEFALILPILLLLLLGIVEVGRLLVIYSSVQAASREGARYAAAAGHPVGSTTPYYLDTAGIQAAARRVTVLTGLSGVNVSYDEGPGSGSNQCPGTPITVSQASDIEARDRVNVNVRAVYTPLFGLTALRPFTITATTCRTIIKQVVLADYVGFSGTATNPPEVTITDPVGNNGNFTAYDGDCVSFAGSAFDNEDGAAITNITWTSSLYPSGYVMFTGTGQSVCGLIVGTHTVSAQATDSDGNTGIATITVEIRPMEPPVLLVISPVSGATFQEGQTINFQANVTDSKDTDLPSKITWTLNGALIDTGDSFTRNDLTSGNYTLVVAVTDSDSMSDSETLSFTVIPDAPPSLSVTPPDGTLGSLNAPVTLTGTAMDVKDGDISSQIQWTCACNGGTQGPVTGKNYTTPNLQQGTHTITASVTDSNGHTVTKTVNIYVTANTAPSVNFVRPPTPTSGATYNQDQTLTFRATVSDAEETLNAGNVRWYLDGASSAFAQNSEVNLSTLTSGSHTVTAKITDSGGLEGVNSVVFTINTPPTVTIIKPPAGASIKTGVAYNFQGTATDQEDGNIWATSQIRWSSSLDGSLGQGGSITKTLTTVGTHVITASVTDKNGMTATATRSVTVYAPICPQAGTLEFLPNNGTRNSLVWNLTVNGVTQPNTEIRLVALKLTIGSLKSTGLVSQVQVDLNPVSFTGNGQTPVLLSSPYTIYRSSNSGISILFVFSPQMKGSDSGFTILAQFEGCPEIPSGVIN